MSTTTEGRLEIISDTCLQPDNNALGGLLNSSAGQQLATNPAGIQALFEYHILNGSYPSSAITNMTKFIPTALTNQSYTNVTGGQSVKAMMSGGKVEFISGLLQNCTVVQADLKFTGGIIHVINNVLTLPQNVSTTLIDAGLSSLYGALNITNLLNTVNDFGDVTIFAPSNKLVSIARCKMNDPNMVVEHSKQSGLASAISPQMTSPPS
jgi:uncharacterized surface protein with fasciclin (FAS1) repeats